MTQSDQKGWRGWSATHRALATAVAGGLGLPGPGGRPGGGPGGGPAASPVDWALFEGLVGRHRVAPLVHRSDLPALGAPDATVERVGALAMAAAVRALAQLRLVIDLVAALRSAGIDVLVLKGLPLAQVGYGGPAARDPGDIDLLIDPRRVNAAADLLLDRGLTVQPWSNGPPPALIRPALDRAADLPALSEISFDAPDARIDLHWRLFENSALFPVSARWLTEPEHVQVGPALLPVLPAAELWPYVAVHGTEHGWRRLKWLADVPALARRPYAADLDGRPDPRADRSMATALLIAEAVFGPFLPAGRRGRAAAVPGAAVLRTRSLVAIVGDTDPDESIGPRHIAGYVRARLAFRRDLAYRREEARTWLIRAGRAHLIPAPSIAVLLAGPVRWAARHLPRRAGRPPGAGDGWRGAQSGPAGWLLDRRWGRWAVRHGARAYRRAGRVAGLARLGAGRRGLLAEAVVELARASAELALLPSSRIVPRLGERAMAEPVAGPEQTRAAALVGSAVTAAARRLPWHPTCLRQAVAASRMLRRRGIGGRIHLGVATEPGSLAAHAWVTVGGRVVLGGGGADRFTPVAAFAGRPAGEGTATCPAVDHRPEHPTA